MSQSALYTFYEEQVLPSLFERLDRAFSEFRWTRTTCGWTAQRVHENGTTNVARSIVCHQNWGFVDQFGAVTSWLEYANGTHGAHHRDFVSAVRHLASLAGIHESALPTGYSNHDVEQACANERRRHLVESYIGYCQAALHHEAGRTARQGLHHEFQLDEREVLSLPIGYFTTADDVAQRMTSAGFSREEIIASHVVCDPRLEGRLIVPWRDRWGRVATIVALDTRDVRHGSREVLYLRGGLKPQAFGLDVALRPCSGGRDHLVFVDGIVDVLYLQSLGVSNVAATAAANGPVTTEQWQQLADQGVRSVTLVLGGQDRWAERTVTSLKQSYAAEQAPTLFTLTSQELAGATGAASFVRREGLERFRRILKNRVHGFHFVALDIVERQRSSTTWNDQSARQTLYEAAEFDRAQRQSRYAGDLERYFWPAIVAQTGLHPGQYQSPQQYSHAHAGRDMEGLFSPQLPPVATTSAGPGGLLSELESSLRSGDTARFEALLTAAARDIRNAEIAATRRPDVRGATWMPQHGSDASILLNDLQHAHRAGDLPRFRSLIAAAADAPSTGRWHWPRDERSSHDGWHLPNYVPLAPSTWDTESVRHVDPWRGTHEPSPPPVDSTQIRDLAYALWDQRVRPQNWVDSFYTTEYPPRTGNYGSFANTTAARGPATNWENDELVVH